MATDSYKLGPGTLKLGTGLDQNAYEMQLTNCRVEPSENVDEGDDLDLLDGTTLEGDDNVTYTYVLAGTAVQDLIADGFTDYTWTNKGEEMAFEFVPVTARVAEVNGVCRIRPVTIGGDVKVRNTADFEFVCIGEPAFTPEAP